MAAAVSIVPEKRDAKMCATQRIRTSQKKQFIVCKKISGKLQQKKVNNRRKEKIKYR